MTIGVGYSGLVFLKIGLPYIIYVFACRGCGCACMFVGVCVRVCVCVRMRTHASLRIALTLPLAPVIYHALAKED